MTTEQGMRVSSWRLLLGKPVTVVSATVLVIIAVASVTANWIAPYGVNDIEVPNALQRSKLMAAT